MTPLAALAPLADVGSCRRTARELHALADACQVAADTVARQRNVSPGDFDGWAAEAFRERAQHLVATADRLHDRAGRLARAFDTFASESAQVRALARAGEVEPALALQRAAEDGLHAALVKATAPDHEPGFRAHHQHRHHPPVATAHPGSTAPVQPHVPVPPATTAAHPGTPSSGTAEPVPPTHPHPGEEPPQHQHQHQHRHPAVPVGQTCQGAPVQHTGPLIR